jgi:hypothetical protein
MNIHFIRARDVLRCRSHASISDTRRSSLSMRQSRHLTAQHANRDLDHVQQIPKFPSRIRFHCLTAADERVTQ